MRVILAVWGFWLMAVPLWAFAEDQTENETGSTSAEDAELRAALEEAAQADEADIENGKGLDATYQEEVQQEDPFNAFVYQGGGKEVVGNEANPSISFILDAAFGFFSEDEHFRQGGHAPTTTGPAIQGAELAASAAIDPYFRFDLAFGLFHRHLEEAYATTSALPWNLQLRAGQFKSNVGRHNPTHLHMWHFVTPPLANEFIFGAEGVSLPGTEVSVLVPFPWYVEIVGALQMGDAGSFKTDFSTNPSFADFIYPVRLVQFFDLSDDFALQWGLNTVQGTSQSSPQTGNRIFVYGADLMFKWRPIGQGQTGYRSITAMTEIWFREMEVIGDLWRDIGSYSDLIFTLSKQWTLALRGELWKRMQGSQENPGINRDRYGLDAIKGSASVSFSPSHFSRVRLQYSYERIENFDDNQAVLVQLEVSAGAHGAHKY